MCQRILADRRPTTVSPIVTHARIRIPALSRLAVEEQRSANDLYILRQSLSHSGEPGPGLAPTDLLPPTEYSTRYRLYRLYRYRRRRHLITLRNGREMEAHLVQTRGRAPAGPFVSPTATSTSTSTSAISPLPPPSRPLPSLPLPSLLPAQPQAHAQPRPRPSDETFTAAASTRTDVRSSVQTQTQFTSDRVSGPGPVSVSGSVPIPVSEIACTSEEGGGKKTKKEKKEKVPKVKTAKEVQEKVKVKQPRFVSVPCSLSRLPCPVSCVSFCFISRPVVHPRPCYVRSDRPLISVSSRSSSLTFYYLFSFLVSPASNLCV